MDLVPKPAQTGSPPIHMSPCGLASACKVLQTPSPDSPAVDIWPLPVGRSSIHWSPPLGVTLVDDCDQCLALHALPEFSRSGLDVSDHKLCQGMELFGHGIPVQVETPPV